ncbi:MAG: hypothetical protein ACI86X_002188 [Moritella sp.]|jgi:hypothetical protein
MIIRLKRFLYLSALADFIGSCRAISTNVILSNLSQKHLIFVLLSPIFIRNEFNASITSGRISSEQVKRDIFGKELFDDNLKSESLTKYKRDIARGLGII